MYKAYVWLITTIRDYGPMTLNEINDLWIKDKVNEGNGLDRSKFFRYRSEIEENFHIVIDFNMKEGYYIKNPEIFRKDCIENWMLSTLVVNHAIETRCYTLPIRLTVGTGRATIRCSLTS